MGSWRSAGFGGGGRGRGAGVGGGEGRGGAWVPPRRAAGKVWSLTSSGRGRGSRFRGQGTRTQGPEGGGRTRPSRTLGPGTTSRAPRLPGFTAQLAFERRSGRPGTAARHPPGCRWPQRPQPTQVSGGPGRGERTQNPGGGAGGLRTHLSDKIPTDPGRDGDLGAPRRPERSTSAPLPQSRCRDAEEAFPPHPERLQRAGSRIPGWKWRGCLWRSSISRFPWTIKKLGARSARAWGRWTWERVVVVSLGKSFF